QDPSQKDIGYVGEKEAIIWVLTMAGHQIGPIFWIDHLAWFTPYMFVNSSYAMATGREVYGYPKEWGWFHLPPQPDQLTHLSVEADVFPTYSPATPATRKPVLTIDVTSPGVQAPGLWRTQRDCFKEIISLLYETEQDLARDIALPGLGLSLEALESLLTGAVPFVFLKQFRDVKEGHKPCYQAIVEANTTLAKFRRGGLLNGDFNTQIANFDSHPIVHDLGLGSATPPVKLACWLDFDFVTEAGKEVLRIV
ncbi:MAG: hypothetical protein AAFU71_12315, partial [Cyanobacteria bacterium J06632_22]